MYITHGREEKMAEEKNFENKIKKYLKEKGIWYVKTWSNGIQRKGIPDIIACVNGYFLGVEVKGMNGVPSDLQKREIRQIRKSNGVAMVLYPDEFEVFKVLIEQLIAEENVGNYYNFQWVFDEGIIRKDDKQ